MKYISIILFSVVLLMSCSNDRAKQSDTGWNEYAPVILDDSSSQDDLPNDSTESEKGKPNAINSSTKSVTRRSDKPSGNMRGFDPASEDDMDDNGMNRYFENNDDEGWD